MGKIPSENEARADFGLIGDGVPPFRARCKCETGHYLRIPVRQGVVSVG